MITISLVAGFIGQVLIEAAKGVLGNQANAGAVAAWKAVNVHFHESDRMLNHDLERAVVTCFLKAQVAVCEHCLENELLRERLEAKELAWIEHRALLLRAQLGGSRKAQQDVPLKELTSVSLLVDPDAPDQQVENVSARLVKAAIGDSFPPIAYQDELRKQLFIRMSDCFKATIKYDKVVRPIFEAQLLVVMRRELRSLRDDLDGKLDVIIGRLLASEGSTTVSQAEVRVFDLAGHQRNEFFTGRVDVLQQLADGFHGVRDRRQVLVGMGGLGKTQVAVQYCLNQRTEYRVVFWVPAEHREAVPPGLAKLAALLGLVAEPVSDVALALSAIQRWMQMNDGWLLVLDNLESEEAMNEYFPAGIRGHLLATSRVRDWSPSVHVVEISQWTSDEAVSFLNRRIGREDPKSAELAAVLGHLPLALEQAAAFIRNGCSVTKYLELLQTHRQKLLSERGSSIGNLLPVYTTWDVSFAAIEGLSPITADLLKLCAFYAPEPMPLELFSRGAQDLPGGLREVASDEFKLRQAAALLHKYSLATCSDDKLAIHRLIQAVVQDQLGVARQEEWKRLAIATLDAGLDFDQNIPATYPWMALVVPHALAVTAGDASVLDQRTVSVLERAGRYLQETAQYEVALRTLKRAVALAENLHGHEHVAVGELLVTLGTIYLDLGNPIQAKACYDRAVSIFDHGGAQPGMVARVLYEQGFVHRILGEDVAAKAYYEQALSMYQNISGPNQSGIANTLNGLAEIIADTGDLEGARALCESALRIREETTGKNSAHVATILGNLGLLYGRMGKPQEAKVYFQRAREMNEMAYGSNHPAVARDFNNLGGLLFAQGDLAGAKDCCRRALGIDEGVFGSNHPDVAMDHNNLGEVLLALGELDEAKSCFERSLRIRSQLLGPDHPLTQEADGFLREVIRRLGLC